MALTRFNGNVVPFASESTTDNRTVFGDVVQADDIDSNLNADFKKGWEIVGLNDNPTKQDFNAMGYTLGALTSYLYQMGIAEHNVSQEYKLNGLCIGTDGTIYQSLVDSNIGNALNDVSKWKNVTESYVTLTGDQTIAGTKTFSSNPISSATQSTNANALTKYSAVVKNTGDETIAGVKTFSSSPIVPTPTTGTQAVNKDYVDNGAGATFVANDTRVKTALNASGTAPIYACRAWVNFNGMGTVAIRASGNVSSITDNGTGNYTVNFTTAIPDSNYVANVTVKQDDSGGGAYVFGSYYAGAGSTVATVFTPSAVRVTGNIGNAFGLYDCIVVNVSIFR
jgi:hypothetical protein